MGVLSFGLLQLFATVITVVISMQFTTTTAWISFVYAIGLGHFMLAIVYSRQQFTSTLSNRHSWLPLIVIIALGIYLYKSSFPLILYFGIHHILNDVYARNSQTQFKNSPRTKAIVLSSLACNSLGLLAILHESEKIFYIPRAWFVGLFLVSFLIHCCLLARQPIEGKAKFALSNLSSEVIYLLLLPLSFLYQLELLHVVLYHVIFWSLLPITKFDRPQTHRYILLTVIVTGFFLMISPIGIRSMQIPIQLFMEQFFVWTYIHITLAFATSSAHPTWLVRLFAAR